MEHIIVGTAGHVDHGKTELTARLTGINTDRLPEEKKRGMTIELGFVPLDLENGLRLGLIDVPGHERFVKNMLAGAAGMDMVMLIVAADEGVMPQTVEHMNIIHLLEIDKGVVVITKSDLVDEEWLELIHEQVQEMIAGTSLQNAPIVSCSAVSGQGIDELRKVLQDVASQVKPKTASGHCRLPVDRVFSKSGFGTVVTGTLWMGKLKTGDSVQIWPVGREARIRSLQVHGQSVTEAVAGQRTAVNLSGVDLEETPRGAWLAAPGLLRESYRLDVSLRLLADARALPQRCRVRVHHGTAEVLARVSLLDREELLPGESCYCQLVLEEPLPPLRGDKLILRSYSPMYTIGGATVLDANPPRHKRYREDVLAAMEQKSQADAGSALLDVLAGEKAPVNLKALAKDAQTPVNEVETLVEQLIAEERIFVLPIDGEDFYLMPEKVDELMEAVLRSANRYHEKYPLRAGLPLAEVRSRFCDKFSQKQVNALVNAWVERKAMQLCFSAVACPGFQARPSGEQQKWLDHLSAEYATHLFDPPEWAEITAALRIPAGDSPELLQWLTEQGKVKKIGDLVFSAQSLAEAERRLREISAVDGFTLAEARDALGSSRKFVLPLLEAMDMARITQRVGDKRVFVN
ncbi:MAG: selenocysteine-specific translation elongation factor [Firmicutes bacterium]|nr:selenocysteine-specific translation elongation factor [Bacillota bacterium]